MRPQVLPVQSASILQPLFNLTPPLQNRFATPQPQTWPAPSPTQPLPINTPQHFTVNMLQLCPPLVRSCYGCSQSLKPGGVIAHPPHDLVIISVMNRSFRDPSTLEMRFRKGNVYFYVQESCIRRKQPYFIPQMASVPHGLLLHLKAEHMHFLRQYGLQV